MKSSWTSAFKKDFNLNGATDIYFWKSEWEVFDPHDYHDTKVSLYYFAYRFFYMAWFVGTYPVTFVWTEELDFYWMYLTNQTYSLQVIYSVLYFTYICWTYWCRRGHSIPRFNNRTDIETTSEPVPSQPIPPPSKPSQSRQEHNRPPSEPIPSPSEPISSPAPPEVEQSTFPTDNYRLPFMCKLLWILINILNVAPYIITAIYWLFLYDSKVEIGTGAFLTDIFVHGLNSPLMLLDAFIMAVPIRISHTLFAGLFAVYYVVFSILYEVINGRYNVANDRDNIYHILNWRNDRGRATGCAVGATFCAFVIHLVMAYGIYRLRIYIKSKFSKYKANDS